MVEFDWLIHYKCNYRCPYCFLEGFWKEVEQKNKYFPPGAWVNAWKRIYDKYGEFNMVITGGEPFLYPQFIILLMELSKYATLNFDTNFSCEKGELSDLVKNINPAKIHMSLSFHPLFADLGSFLEKAKFLQRHGFDFIIHYVTFPPQLDSLECFRDIFTKRGFKFVPIAFRGVYGGKAYPESFTSDEANRIHNVIIQIEDKKLKEWANNVLLQSKTKDRLCNAGRFYARVDSDGAVYFCGNDYTKSGGKNCLGNIFEENFSLRDEPTICRQDSCPCEFRWLIS
jgi:sulfatase maturation enzyme AslB (radical SAM superfamily)